MDKIVAKLCQYILDNLEHEITMDELETVFFYNKFYLIRLFKLYTGYTIKGFINNVKVLKTIDSLLFTNDTILKIALNNGFNSQEYYSEKFRDVIGMSPFQFRKEYSNIENSNNINELKTKKEYLLNLKQWQLALVGMPDNIESKSKTMVLKK